MDETTYSDDKVIDFINKNLIPVRVDSDRRPDIDSLYNQGGWPSTVLLTPDGEILAGETYLPPERMLSWLKENLEIYRGKKKVIRWHTERLKKQNRQSPFGKEKSPGRYELERVVELLENYFDPMYGGFGEVQKFPNPFAIEFLLSYYQYHRGEEIGTIIRETLDAMRRGEIYDRIEGGFFRYSTRPDWSEPHYEKMLESNAGIIMNYLNAYRVFNEKDYLGVALKSLNYIRKYLYDEKRGFLWGSQDADEGYYRAANRSSLKPPLVDRTFYADSSAMMVSTLTVAYSVTGNRYYLRWAQDVMGAILRKLYSGVKGVYHYYDTKKSLPGLLRDNLTVANALIDLYEVTGRKWYLKKADNIIGFVTRFFADGLFRRSISERVVEPASRGIFSDYSLARDNYLAFYVLNRYSLYNQGHGIARIRGSLARRLSGSYDRFVVHAGLYGLGLIRYLLEPVEIKIVRKGDITTYLKEIGMLYIPNKIIRIYDLRRDREIIKREGFPPEEALYICYRKSCSRPIKRPSEIKKGLRIYAEPSMKIN